MDYTGSGVRSAGLRNNKKKAVTVTFELGVVMGLELSDLRPGARESRNGHNLGGQWFSRRDCWDARVKTWV